jgi:hypothetical protein
LFIFSLANSIYLGFYYTCSFTGISTASNPKPPGADTTSRRARAAIDTYNSSAASTCLTSTHERNGQASY